MEQYFEKLQKIATTAVADLGGMCIQHQEMQRSYLEDRQKGNLTEQGYQGLVQALDSTRNKRVKEVKDKIAALQDEYNSAVDKYTALSSAAIANADVEMLKSLPITIADFDLLVEKHSSNPTMLRLLDAYRIEHNMGSNWRYQSPEQRKDVFNSLCWAVEAIVTGASVARSVLTVGGDLFGADREQRIAYLVSSAYHKLQGSDPNKFPIPDTEENAETHNQMRYLTIF